jgi:ATP-dependent RNA/DNA helicase IGHMBP2
VQNQQTRYTDLIKGIDAERKHEVAFFKNYQTNKTNQEKISMGLLWHPVKINRKSFTIGDYLEIEVERTKYTEQSHRFTEGVSAQLFNHDCNPTHIKVTVVKVHGNKIRLLAHADVMDCIEDFESGMSGVELVYDDRPYQVMEKAMKEVIGTKSMTITNIKSAIDNPNFVFREIENFQNPVNLTHRTDLNPSQKSAIISCLKAEQIGVIHGPPGTGKTTTLVALIQELAQIEGKILVCAPSNNAVDLLAKKMDDKGISVIRIGNISRIHDDLAHLTIEEKVHNHLEWNHIKKVKIRIQDVERQAGQYKRQFGPEERELRKQLRKEARDLRKWALELEDRLVQDIILSTTVIATTLIGAANKIIDGIKFQTVIVDEASQTLEPECWNAIIRGNRVIIAGDHMQLPPTVKSADAKLLGFNTTILDRVIGKVPFGGLLDIQYRMHGLILAFSNMRYYENKLNSAACVETRTLKNDNQPLIFIDTAGCGFEEVNNPEHKSYTNHGEYFILREHIMSIRERLLGYRIGIISPYAEQVRYIRSQVAEDDDLRIMDIEVNSIDGFQGQEKDLIYLSMVRSNDNSEIGFIKDERRLNVALTRAKSKIVIVGDSSTIATHEVYANLVDHITATGHYDSAWTYMS